LTCSAALERAAEFPSARARVEYLFQRYEQLTAPLTPSAKSRRTRKPRAPHHFAADQTLTIFKR